MIFNARCAEQQIVAVSPNKKMVVFPRRPMDEFEETLSKIASGSLLVIGIALFNQQLNFAYEWRKWLESRYRTPLEIKIKPSQQYRDLVDAAMRPCPGPNVFSLVEVGPGRFVIQSA